MLNVPVRVFVASTLVLGCGRQGGNEPAVQRSCPAARGPEVIARGVERYGRGFPLRWVDRARLGVFEMSSLDLGVKFLGPLTTFESTSWDGEAWYRMSCKSAKECFDPLSRVEHGSLERIDRLSGVSSVLARNTSSVGDPISLDEFVYWAVQRDGPADVFRVPKLGGNVERFNTAAYRQRVSSLRAYPKLGVLVERSGAVDWISRNGESRTVFQAVRIGSAVLDGEYVYATDLGGHRDAEESSMGPTGRIVRVLVRDGSIQELAHSLDAPVAIATHDEGVYFLLDGSSDVWMIPTQGGAPPRRVVDGVSYDRDKGEESLELWAHRCGLLWVYGNSAQHADRTIVYAPWQAIR